MRTIEDAVVIFLPADGESRLANVKKFTSVPAADENYFFSKKKCSSGEELETSMLNIVRMV